LRYQWHFNGTPIPGATNSNYTRNNLSDPDEGNYHVVVTNAAGAAASATAALRLHYAQANDNFACRTDISGTNITLPPQQNSGATAESGEPSHSSASGAPAQYSIWYRWIAPFTGGAVIDVTPYFNTPAVAVYTNRPGPASVTNLAKVADNSSIFGKLRCAFTALAGQEYALALDGAELPQAEGHGLGTFDLNLRLAPPPPNDRFTNATGSAGYDRNFSFK